MLESFFIYGSTPANAEKVTYTPWIVLVSYFIAVFASYTSLALAKRLILSKTLHRKRMLHLGGALALGSGIWSMHFIGMLAYQMRMQVSYDPWLTALSMLLAVTAAWFVLKIVQHSGQSRKGLFAGAVLLGLGIAAMHYSGMAAMRMRADIRYIPSLFFLSVFIAIAASGAAMKIMFTLGRYSGIGTKRWKLMAALVMGAAICGMHYTGMAAAVIIPYPDCSFDSNRHDEMLVITVVAVTGIISMIALVLGVSHRLLTLSMCGAVFAVPLMTIVYHAVSEFDNNIAFTDKERAGMQYHEALFDLTLQVQKLRGLTFMMRLDKEKPPHARAEQVHHVRTWINIVDNTDLQTRKQLNIRSSWEEVKQLILSRLEMQDTLAPVEEFSRYTEVVEKLHLLMLDVGTNLTLDPKLDSYTLASTLVETAPNLVETMGKLRGLTAGWLSLQPDPSLWEDEQIKQLQKLYYNLGHYEHDLAEKFARTRYQNKGVEIYWEFDRTHIEPRLQAFKRDIENIAFHQTNDLSPKKLFDEGTALIEEYDLLYDKTSIAFSKVLDSRYEDYMVKRYMVFYSSIVAFMGVIVLFTFLFRTLSKSETTVHKLHRTREELTGEKVRLQTIMDSMMEGIITIDAKGAIQAFNIGAEKMFGYENHEVIGKNVSILMPQPDRNAHDDYLHRYRQTGEARIIGRGRELMGVDKHGRQFPITLSVKNMIIDGQLYFIGLTRDISEQKRKEDELKLAKDEAERANISKSDFLANVSHEIRTPMNGVLGMAGLLLDTDLNEEQRGWAEIIKKSGDNLMEIINDILDFSKIEAGKLVLEPVTFDLEATLMEVTDLLVLRTQEKGIDLLVDIAPDVPRCIVADPVRFKQMLFNLAGNAIKFTEKGYVLIRIKCIHKAAKRLRLHVEVEDTGIGILPDKLNHIFDKFAQAEQSTTRRFGGTGLGLTICKKLAEMMGGNVYAASESGVGSTFSFQIMVQQAQEPLPAYAELPDSDLAGVRALIVDDSRPSRDILFQYLQGWHMQYEAADTAEAALVMLQAAAKKGLPYHFVFIDYCVSGTKGLQLAEWIRSSDVPLDATLFMVTAVGQVVTSLNLDRYGFAAFLVKPFYPGQLKAALQLLWNARQHKKSLPLVTRYTVSQMLNTKTYANTVTADLFSGMRVLVVEDMRVNLMLITKVLKKHGCEVFTAENGKIAVEMLQKEQFDIVFMDCQMPEMDGFEATRHIRRNEEGVNHTVIVALTADAMIGDREKCLNAGMDDYLNKPLKPEKVTEMLQKWRRNAA